MLKKTVSLLIAAALAVGGTACKGKPTDAQANAELEKKWRAQQRQRAVKYYTELAEKFPDAPQAAQAKERLQALGVPEGAKTAQK